MDTYIGFCVLGGMIMLGLHPIATALRDIAKAIREPKP